MFHRISWNHEHRIYDLRSDGIIRLCIIFGGSALGWLCCLVKIFIECFQGAWMYFWLPKSGITVANTMSIDIWTYRYSDNGEVWFEELDVHHILTHLFVWFVEWNGLIHHSLIPHKLVISIGMGDGVIAPIHGMESWCTTSYYGGDSWNQTSDVPCHCLQQWNWPCVKQCFQIMIWTLVAWSQTRWLIVPRHQLVVISLGLVYKWPRTA